MEQTQHFLSANTIVEHIHSLVSKHLANWVNLPDSDCLDDADYHIDGLLIRPGQGSEVILVHQATGTYRKLSLDHWQFHPEGQAYVQAMSRQDVFNLGILAGFEEREAAKREKRSPKIPYSSSDKPRIQRMLDQLGLPYTISPGEQ